MDRLARIFASRMKKAVLCLLIGLGALCASGQYASPNATSASGGHGESASVQLHWTLGEPVILTLESTSSQLTCGLHQTDEFCFGDFNFDGAIDTIDILILLGEWQCPGTCLADMNQDGSVDTADILLLLGTYGTPCF